MIFLQSREKGVDRRNEKWWSVCSEDQVLYIWKLWVPFGPSLTNLSCMKHYWYLLALLTRIHVSSHNIIAECISPCHSTKTIPYIRTCVKYIFQLMMVLKMETDSGSPWKTPIDRFTGLDAHTLQVMVTC
jgi:hypothetical protein